MTPTTMLGKFQNITFRSLFFSVMPRSSSSCFSETKLYYIPDKHLALFFAFCCVFCPFLLLFQLQGIWSSLSRRFTPRHAPTRLPCATNSFSALKLKITTSFLSFSPPLFFSTEKLGLIFSFCHFPPSSHFVLIFCRLVLPLGRLAGTPHSVIQFSPRNDFPSLFVPLHIPVVLVHLLMVPQKQQINR